MISLHWVSLDWVPALSLDWVFPSLGSLDWVPVPTLSLDWVFLSLECPLTGFQHFPLTGFSLHCLSLDWVPVPALSLDWVFLSLECPLTGFQHFPLTGFSLHWVSLDWVFPSLGCPLTGFSLHWVSLDWVPVPAQSAELHRGAETLGNLLRGCISSFSPRWANSRGSRDLCEDSLPEEAVHIILEVFGAECRDELVKLTKGGFGLPESLRLWYLEYKKALVSLGGVELRLLPGFFVFYNERGGLRAMACSHVDDTRYAGDATSPQIWKD